MSEVLTSSREEWDKEAGKLSGQVLQTEEWWRKERADEVARNLAYYRGQFWQGDGLNPLSSAHEAYTAQRNEIFPIIDQIASALAMDLPQCEALPHRQRSYRVPTRAQDETFAGRRIASVLNLFAELDEVDTCVQELIVHAELFDEGGTVKTTWSPELGRSIWRVKMPWEVQFDPAAKRVQDAAWAFERFPVHIDTLRERIKSELYERPKQEIRADAYPRGLLADHISDEAEEKARAMGLREYVNLVEYWDQRRGWLYHLHPETKAILMKVRRPWARPYEKLIFHAGVGRWRGIADVTMLAPIQRDINELVSARREIVNRLPRRMLVDEGLWETEDQFTNFAKSRTYEPTRIKAPADGTIEGRIYVTPPMDTSFDFNQHLDQDVDHVKRIVGDADFTHGVVKNIRTAEEAKMVGAATSGRIEVRSRRVIRLVTSMFRTALDTVQWALKNPEASRIDLDGLTDLTQVDCDAATLEHELLNEAFHFRILPFSPLMEDRNVRRDKLRELLVSLAPTPASAAVDWHESLRELFDLHGMRPSCVLPPVPLVPPVTKPEPPAPAAPPPAGGDPMQQLTALLGASAGGAAPAGGDPMQQLTALLGAQNGGAGAGGLGDLAKLALGGPPPGLPS